MCWEMDSGLQSVKFRVMFVRKVAVPRDWWKLSQRNHRVVLRYPSV